MLHRTAATNRPHGRRLVSFQQRRYTIRGLLREKIAAASRQVVSVTGCSLAGGDATWGKDIERANRDYVEDGHTAASRARAIAFFQRESASGARRDRAIHRDLRGPGDL